MACFRLRGHLMAQMAVWTIGVVRRIVVMQAADGHRGEYQQCDERQRNPEDSYCVSHGHFGGLGSVTKPH